jgi:hypothetical protein
MYPTPTIEYDVIEPTCRCLVKHQKSPKIPDWGLYFAIFIFAVIYFYCKLS